jgi:hypothetical protein
MQIQIAQARDLIFIRDLQRKYTGSIGFIPSAATEREVNKGNVLHGSLNDDDAGFLLIHPSLTYQPNVAAIVQAAVRMDAQRQAVGLELVKRAAAIAHGRGQTVLQASCREDLESNLFWAAAGFKAIGTKPGGFQRGKELIIWRKALTEGIDLESMAEELYTRGPGGRFTSREKATHIKLLAL